MAERPDGTLFEQLLEAEMPLEDKIRHMISAMSLDQKINQMSGDMPRLRGLIELAYAYNTRPYPAGADEELGIPALMFTDGPRGVVMGQATCFPVAMARGAAWDIDLEERVADAMGVEARVFGANFMASVCLNVLRHPAWGRAQETYGEDPYHLGEMGAAHVRGAQRHVMACAKHFAVNNIENNRMTVDAKIDERTLRENYLPQFRRCIDEGVAAIMSAYNRVNGQYCGHNSHLLRDILKGEWGFDGLVISDFIWGIRDTVMAANGGCDVEMPLEQHYGKKLRQSVEDGQVDASIIDEAVSRILRRKFQYSRIGKPDRYRLDAVASPEHRALAREAAQKSMVLLVNETPSGDWRPLLPIELESLERLAVIGGLANIPNIGDDGSSKVRPAAVVTPLQGICAAAGPEKITFDDGQNIEQAKQLAARSDFVIIVVGFTAKDEGEFIKYPWKTIGGDRERLRLTAHEEDLIQAVVAANSRTVVVMMGGGAIITENWRRQVGAMIMAWYPGMEGGHALADILFGRANPSGKLPCIFPQSEMQLPYFDNKAEAIFYDTFHGYRLLDKRQQKPAFNFGYGLSYTTFEVSDMQVEPGRAKPQDILRASAKVTNSGHVQGEAVIQFYVGYGLTQVKRATKELKGFRRLALAPGEDTRVTFELPVQNLAYYDADQAGWKVELSNVWLYVGTSADEADLLARQIDIVDDEEGSLPYPP